jgi:hypothetical protein
MSLMPDESEAAPLGDPGDAVEDYGAPGTPNKLNDAVMVGATGDYAEERVLEYLQEARGEENGGGETKQPSNGSAFRKFKATDEGNEAGLPSPTSRAPSSAGSYSTPDDTPSLHVCIGWRIAIHLAYSFCRAPSLLPHWPEVQQDPDSRPPSRLRLP